MTRARANARLDQHEPAEAGVALLADDDVVVHHDAERLRGSDDLLGHLDVGARRRRIARGVIVHERDRLDDNSSARFTTSRT